MIRRCWGVPRHPVAQNSDLGHGREMASIMKSNKLGHKQRKIKTTDLLSLSFVWNWLSDPGPALNRVKWLQSRRCLYAIRCSSQLVAEHSMQLSRRCVGFSSARGSLNDGQPGLRVCSFVWGLDNGTSKPIDFKWIQINAIVKKKSAPLSLPHWHIATS